MFVAADRSFFVCRKYVGQFLGAQGKKLLKLIEKSRVLRMHVEDTNGTDTAYITIIGHKENVNIALVLLDGEMTLFQQREELDSEVLLFIS